MKLNELIKGTGPDPLEDRYADIEICDIACDSRRVKTGSLFVALKGETDDGTKYIDEAISSGAKTVVCREDINRQNDNGVCFLKVPEPRAFLKEAAARFFPKAADIQPTGVTGTNGKTTVTYLLESIFHQANRRCGVIGTINQRIVTDALASVNTTPGLIDLYRFFQKLRDENISDCVMEVSSHALKQNRMAGIIFSSAVFTNLSPEHLDYHADMEDYYRSKARLFKEFLQNGPAVINADDSYGQRLICELKELKKNVITFGIDHPADVRAGSISGNLQGSEFFCLFAGQKIFIKTPLIGRHNVYNVLASAAAARSEGVSLEDIRCGIERLGVVPGRLERIKNARGLNVFLDYAHTDDALKNVLTGLRAVSDNEIILLFGCGGGRDRSKRAAMGKTACWFADYAIVTSDNPRFEDPQAIIDEIVPGFEKENYEVCPNRLSAIERALALADEDKIVLIAGKGHEDYQIIKDKKLPFNERQIITDFLNV